MTTHDVSHIEIYARDKIPVIRRLVSALGFTRVADSVEVDRSSVLLRRGDVRVVVTSGWATCPWGSRPAERVAEIAVLCEDVNATRDAALAAGATVTRSAQGHPIVSGIADVTCTLLPAGARTGFPSDGRNWVPNSPQTTHRDAPGATHVALRFDPTVPDQQAAFYRDVLNVARPSSASVSPLAGTDVLAPQSASGRVSVVLVAGDRTG